MAIVVDQPIGTLRRPAAAQLDRHLSIPLGLLSRAWAALGHAERLRQMSDRRLEDIGLDRHDIPDARSAIDRTAACAAVRFHVEL